LWAAPHCRLAGLHDLLLVLALLAAAAAGSDLLVKIQKARQTDQL
jgi:hypothetical protein